MSDAAAGPPSALAGALASQYRLERELGRGGMATVYLAQDLKHRRPVALKVLLPELAQTLGPERFQREIETAAHLQHPHILTVYDSGDAAGQLWFTMPYVEGESLRDRMDRERQLPVADAVRIAREAAQGLAYAHRHGVLHRDIKPENLLLTDDGNTLVADFGIARSLAAGEGDRLTATGLSIGTAAYMSPEQAAGERELDARSDVYSLGCVLYEMLVGEPPFTGATAQAVIARRFAEDPRPLRPVRPAVPPGLEAVVLRALARTPADRYATAADFGRALEATTSTTPATTAPTVATTRPTAHGPASFVRRHALTSALGLGLLIGGGALFAWRAATAGPAGAAAGPGAAGPPRLAVLPFENLGDSADAYFADGMTDAVRGKLTGLAGLQVIARGSSVEYAGTTKRPAAIGLELGARYLLTGTVRWDKAPDGASRVQVSPELVEVGADGAASSRWQQPFDAPLTDVFQVQGEIAAKVATAMQVALGGAQQAALAQAPTQNPAAYDAYLRGEAAVDGGSNASPAALRQAILHYEQAVALDTGFALAWSRLATARTLLYVNGTRTRALREEARKATEIARALDPEGTEGHVALGLYYQGVERDPARALPEFEAALRRAPNDANMLRRMANIERPMGRWDAALRHAEASYIVDPRSAPAAGSLVRTLLRLRRPADARPAAERALALAPTAPFMVHQRAMVELALGDLAAARAVLTRARGIPAADLAAYMANYADLGWVLDEAGQQLALSLGPDAFDDDRATWGLARAQLHHWRGDTAQARVWGDTAVRHLAAQLREAPEEAELHGLRGLALAYAGQQAEAVAAGERGVALLPITRDAEHGPYQAFLLARIHLLTGAPDQALDRLEEVVRVPYYITPAWLRIDPTFAPLRGNPRFERLVGARN